MIVQVIGSGDLMYFPLNSLPLGYKTRIQLEFVNKSVKLLSF